MAMNAGITDDPNDKTLFILQSLICLLRERNILSRADIEELCEKVETRADLMPCRDEVATEAATIMAGLSDYIGRRYGGKHRRC